MMSSAINGLLEGSDADAAISVEEALAVLPLAQIDVGRLLDRVDNAILVEAGAGDLGEAGIFRARSAEQELVVLRALPVDAENADMAGMVVPAGIDAAGDFDLQFAQLARIAALGEAGLDLLRDRDRARI